MNERKSVEPASNRDPYHIISRIEYTLIRIVLLMLLVIMLAKLVWAEISPLFGI
jgi:hypothetical protein